jgi:ketosteroid isomerase-like protein
MPSQKTLDDFFAMVVSGQHDKAIAEFYTEDSTMQENLGEVRKGRDGNVARERMTLAAHKSVKTTVVQPVFVNGDEVVIHWIFEFVRQDDSVMRIEELAHQKWRGEKIVEERFYYDPGQVRR